jgi:hypothetical protein
VLVIDTTTTKKKKKKRKRERIKKVCVVVAHLHSRRVRGYLVAHPSSSSPMEEEKRIM